MSDTTHLVTAEELEKFPDDDYRYELVEGRVIRMSPTGAVHGWLVPVILRPADVLDLDDVIQGFRCGVQEIFE